MNDKQNIGFFEEKEGVKSSTRLFSFLLLIFFFILSSFWILSKNPLDGNFTFYSFMLLVGVFTPKYLHKLSEINHKTKKDETEKSS